MRVLMLGDMNSSHFTKWVKGLNDSGVEVHIFTFHKPDMGGADIPRDRIYYGSDARQDRIYEEGSPRKLMLYKHLPKLLKVIKKTRPDILHAHYATSYGLLGALTRFHPYILSVWGSDILTFPGRSFLHRRMIKYTLGKTNLIMATSRLLCNEVQKYTLKEVRQIPFGIDTEKFRKLEGSPVDGGMVIGTIKSLKKIYGIDLLLKVFDKLREQNPDRYIRLLIAGDGPEEKNLKKLSTELGIDQFVEFTGYIPPDEIVKIHNRISVFANLSLSESFGVSVLEASSCQVPVVVSNAGGLPEVVVDKVTGFLVDISNQADMLAAFQSLIDDKSLREKLGRNGRAMVEKKYDWNNNLREMIKVYEGFC